MAATNTSISRLPLAIGLTGAECLPIDVPNEFGTFTTRRTTVATLAGKLGGNLPNLIVATDYGVDPTGTTYCDAGLAAFWAAVTSAPGGWGFLPPGTYRTASDVLWDVAANNNHGFRLSGAGAYSTLIIPSNGRKLRIFSSAGDAFYGTFESIGVLANNPSGPACEISKPDFSDALNGFAFRDFWIKNTAATPASSGLTLNQVYSSTFSNLTTSGGGTDPYGNHPNAGDSLVLRQASFNNFSGSFSSGRSGVRFTQGYNFGNVFSSVDLEVNYDDLVIDNSQSRYNTFIGGQWQWSRSAVNATAGMSNQIINPNYSYPNPIFAGVGIVNGAAGAGSNADITALNALTTNIAVAGTAVQAIGRNLLLNGNFTMNRRNYTSGSALAAGAYAHDRWKANTAGSYTFVQASAADNIASHSVDTTLTLAAGTTITQLVESSGVEGGSLTLSWAGTVTGYVYYYDGSNLQTALAPGASGRTCTVPPGVTLYVGLTGPGTVSTVQLERGAVATPFEREAKFETTRKCLRYFQQYNQGPAGFYNLSGYATSGAAIGFNFLLPVTMRAVPTFIFTGTWTATNVSGTPTVSVGGNSLTITLQASAAGMVSYTSPPASGFTLDAEL